MNDFHLIQINAQEVFKYMSLGPMYSKNSDLDSLSK